MAKGGDRARAAEAAMPTSTPDGSRSTTASRGRVTDVNGTWLEQRNQVTAARDALERKADELSSQG